MPYSLSSGAGIVFTDVVFALNTQPKKLRFTKRKFFFPIKILKELKTGKEKGQLGVKSLHSIEMPTVPVVLEKTHSLVQNNHQLQ